MAKQRYCRVCGEPFTARRFDALTCTSTCWARKARGHDLAYLATLPDYLVEARRFIHEADPVKAEADRHAATVHPVIESIRARGAKSLRAIAAELTRMRIPTARGGTEWSAQQVSNILKRTT
jgi:hypothetical protein